MEYRKRRITFAAIRDRWIESLLILICIAIPVLDFFGILDEIPLLNGKISNFTLLLLALLTGYVAFTQPERQESFQEHISDGINKIFDSISSSSTVVLRARPFRNISAGMDYARKAIERAKQQVLIVYPEIYPDFYQAIPTGTFCKQVFTIEIDRLESYRKVLPASLPRTPRNFSFACFRLPKELLQRYVIIDDKELVILSDLMPIATHNSEFIKVYRQNFDDIWNKAIKLKMNDKTHTDRIESITAPPQRIPEIPADLEVCVRNCLKTYEKIKGQTKEKNA